MKRLLIITFITCAITGCYSSKKWTGFYYPDRNNIGGESSWVIQSGFENIEECRNWVDNIASTNDNYDYECGYDCKYDASWGIDICERTER